MADLEAALDPETLRVRIEAATVESEALDEVLLRVEQGCSRSAALREAFPQRPVNLMLRRLRQYEADGLIALVSKRYGPPAERKMTPEVRGGLAALAKTLPDAPAEVLVNKLEQLFGVQVSVSLVQQELQAMGLARKKGRPSARPDDKPRNDADLVTVETLSLAGAELLKAVCEMTGAVRALTEAIGAHLEQLPPPDGPVLDDRDNRDDHGRFVAEYNAAKPRQHEALGQRFESVEQRRASIDLQQMRVTNESEDTRYRKDLGLVLLPLVVRGGRWSALAHWRGQLLEELVGTAYQPATLDKYLRQLKLAGCAETSREAVARLWLGREGEVVDATTGAVVLYVDASTKPLWTQHFTRSAKVSSTGRIQPATTTMTLHSGAGTPLIFKSYSGTASLAHNALSLLEQFEQHAGEGTAKRLVVMDREAHAISLFKELDARWGFVIPLRKSVLGPSAKFSEQTAWERYNASGDEVCEAVLQLHDRRAGEADLKMRVVARKRHRSGNISWYATNLDTQTLPAADALRLYFERWPLQEQVYRDLNGGVGFDVHHGYGKQLTDNVAVIDQLERLQRQVAGLQSELATQEARRAAVEEERGLFSRTLSAQSPQIAQDRAQFEASLSAVPADAGIDAQHAALRRWEAWEQHAGDRIGALAQEQESLSASLSKSQAKLERKQAEVAQLSRRREIFTVDVELDEIMTAYKLTFLNVCRVLQREYLCVSMEVETLIEAVLSLPGERVLFEDRELVRIYRQERDSETMLAVERACTALSGERLHREGRLLRFEVIDAPPRVRRVDPNQL